MDKQKDLIRMTVHGLTVDNGFVRADVFADKIKSFVQAVKAADSALNKSPKFSLMIKQLKIGSAEAYLDPKQIKRAAKVDAPAPLVAKIASSIQAGSTAFDLSTAKIIRKLSDLSNGSDESHSHVEIEFDEDNVIRFDRFFCDRAKRAIEIAEGVDTSPARWFEGASIGQFDGTIREIDSRGEIVRGKIVLTIDGSELDCTFRRSDLDAVVAAFEARSRIEGVAVYDGMTARPVRIDVRKVATIKAAGDLLKWHGWLRKPNAEWVGLV